MKDLKCKLKKFEEKARCECGDSKVLLIILVSVGVVLVAAGIAFAVYKLLARRYDSYAFDEFYDDDFDEAEGCDCGEPHYFTNDADFEKE